MSEVKRFDFDIDEAGANIRFVELADGGYTLFTDFDAQRLRADTAEAELKELRDSHAALIEDRARFPDRPDFVGDMISAHIGNLKAGKESSDNYARNYILKLDIAEQRLAKVEARYGFLRTTTPRRFKKMQDAASTDGGDVIYFHADRFDAQVDAALNPDPEEESHEIARNALKMENQRITPARFKCLACGDYHEGYGNFPCPKMTPYSGNKP